jgi:hypothetical protein
MARVANGRGCWTRADDKRSSCEDAFMESVRICVCGPLHDPHATNQALSSAASRSKAEVIIFVAAVFELNRSHRARGTRRPAKRRSEASYLGAKAGGTSLGCKCEMNCVGVWGLD